MSQHTSTKEGFRNYMMTSVVGPAEKAKEFIEESTTPAFYLIVNGTRTEYDAYVEMVTELRGSVTEYEIEIPDFLRDGDQLAARMTGTVKVGDTESVFETLMFARIEKETGKFVSQIIRGVQEPKGREAP